MIRLIASVFVLVLLALPATASEKFTQAGFAKAQAAGQPILVHVTAPWCPTCKAQAPVVSLLEKERADLKVFLVDFDSQKDVLRDFRVSSQSTLIAFDGRTEKARSAGETDPVKIRALLR
ncbi:putative Thioredoxin (H-type,TRX-H) [Magnetospirillum sp. LM-5]|uniref:thioredoxin family protein n=1 Tax=Magnetospirillum sp. LM-5 TaxID=2681466 RepID=UPI00137D068E|nr:thioredoxin family protein [Magnetospirillum sp. LM-5]CAA7615331.1 putative Thioredoxin (H-type,TRX-H) [Magnetospirillum sp. LM-5]